MSEGTAVLEYTDTGGTVWRVSVKPIPGSAHWKILRDRQTSADDEFKRHSAIEVRTKPKFAEDADISDN